MKRSLLSCLLFVILINLYGYNYLSVGDPRNSWWTDQGTIEEATLTVHPKGLFIEYGLYLTFSSRGTNWTQVEDTVEVTLMFDLPAGAIVKDSWLWIGDAIVRAKILDKWSASGIYENIVKRRRDPSILSKQSATQYELKVFPMAGNETRKVKITYLMPATWTKSNVSAVIPTTVLNTSRYLPEKFSVLTWLDQMWTNPVIMNDDEIAFTTESDKEFGDYQKAIIPSSKYQKSLSIGFNSPVQNGLYFSKYQNGNEGIYQLAIFPNEFINSDEGKKAAILIDFDASNSNITTKELLDEIKNEMLIKLTGLDSFNLLFSNLSITQYSDKWISASKTNVEAAFNSLNNPLASYSNLPSLLSDGINFIKSHGNDGKVILISNSSQYGNYQVASTLINDIVALMDPKIQIHISDYQLFNIQYNYINGIYYSGNEYFYSNLSKITLGSYRRIGYNLSFTDCIAESFKYIGGSIKSFDLHTRLNTGFCHSRFTMTGANNIAYLNDPILQVGKFKGEFPFTIEISGEYNNEIFSREVELQEQNVSNNDSVSEEIWTGQYIKELESGLQSNDIINEIIYNSLKERVLSTYTSFLCLEDTSQDCLDCEDEPQIITDVREELVDRDSIFIYPNPFADKLTIELICSDPSEVKELSVYNITGSAIYQFSISELLKGKNSIIWNGTTATGEAVKAGLYILTYKTTNEIKSLKILRR